MKRHNSLRVSLVAALLISAVLFTSCGGGGGGTSSAPSTPPSSAAVITSVQPLAIPAGSAGFTLTVNGSGFVNGAVVMFNSAPKPTTFVSSTRVTATIAAQDIAVTGTVNVAVANPGSAPVSNLASFVIGNPQPNPVPSISYLSPNSASAGSAALTIDVNGYNFVPSSIVRWNGSDRSTTYSNSSVLHATISAADLSTVGAAQVVVYNPAPGGGTSSAVVFNVEIPSQKISLTVNKLVYDSTRQRIYASIPNRAATNANTIAVIDPTTASVVKTIAIGSDPNTLALSADASYLYVGLDGTGAIRRLDLATDTPGTEFSLGSDQFFGKLNAADISVMPGNTNVIAVSRRYSGVSPSHAGVAIFDNGVQRPVTTPGHTGSNVIEFGDSPTTLYGFNNETTEWGVRRMTVDSTGVTVTETAASLIQYFGADIKFSAGKIYATTGAVIDPATLSLVGKFNASAGPVAPDAAAAKTYFVTCASPDCTISAFDNSTYLSIGSQRLRITGASTPFNLLRWGTDGFAFSTGDQVVIANFSFTAPPATDKSIDKLPVNHLVYDETRQLVYASVPSSAGARGNSVAVINPASSQIESIIPVGSEPNVLAMSRDARYLYVGLDGAGAVRRVDLTTKTAGLQFNIGADSFSGPLFVGDIAVMPGSAETIAVASRNGVLAIFDNGLRRPNTIPWTNNVNSIAFSDSPDLLYGFNNYSTEFGLRCIRVDASGVTVINTIENLFTGFSTRIRFDSGLLFSSSGLVVDPVLKARVGRFSGGGVSFVIDRANTRAYFLQSQYSKLVLMAFDTEKYTPAGSLTIPISTSISARDMVRAGALGFVIGTSEGVMITNAAFAPAPVSGPGLNKLPAMRLAYDSTRNKIYASVPSRAGNIGNTIAVINPTTSQIENTVWVGSEPNVLALSGDAKYLYVGLDGVGAVRRVDLASLTAGPQFSIGIASFYGPMFAEDIAVLPGNSDAIAVSRRYEGVSPRHAGVAIFDNGIQRAVTTPGHTGANAIEFGDSASTLYGYNNESTDYGFRRMKVDSSGVSVVDSASNIISGFYLDILYDSGRIYSTAGHVVDPFRDMRIGTFYGISGSAGVAADSVAGRVYFLARNGTALSILAFDSSTYLPAGTLNVPGSTTLSASSFIRVGNAGFAMALSNDQVVIANGTFTAPPSGTGIDTLPANHLVYDASRQKLYASVPSRAGARGNSIAVIDPATKNVEKTIFVGSEPNALALSRDWHYLYVGLDGPASIRKVDLTTPTAGQEFNIGTESFFGPMYAEEIAVSPANVDVIAVSRRYSGVSPRHAGVAIFDNGIQRPVTTPVHTGANVIEFSDSPDTMYGYNNESTEFGFRTLKVDADGVTTLSSAADLISGFDANIAFDSGRVYSTNGDIVDPVMSKLVGTFAGAGGSQSVAPDAAAHRVHFLQQNYNNKRLILTYDDSSFNLLGSLDVSNTMTSSSNYPRDLVRCGGAGFAFATDSSVFITDGTLTPPKTLEIATTALPPTSVAKPYRFTLATVGGIVPVTWSVVSGSLPPGLTLSADGRISGTVGNISADYTYTFKVNATDGSTPPASATSDFSILVKAGSLGRNEVCNSATPISYGTISGSLSPYGDVDVYAFDGVQGTIVRIETMADRLYPRSYADTVVQILGDGCSPLAANDDMNESTLDSLIGGFTLPYTGRYYIRVLDARGDGRPELVYDLSLTRY